MTIRSAGDPVVHDMHGSRFASYVAPALGSEQLCAWRLEVPGGTRGVAHEVSHEEVLLMLSGELAISIDEDVAVARAGDVITVPAGATFAVQAVAGPAAAWVVTSVGLRARTGDKAITPPWTL